MRLIHTFEQLTDAQAGRLVKHLFRYVNDQNPSAPDKITSIAFEPIKQQLKRDLKKWEKYIEKQKENGKKGGRPKEPNETQKTQAFSEEPKKADSGNVSVNATVNDLPLSFGEVFFDAEEVINKNQIEFERICMAGKIDAGAGKIALRKFHLHLESNAKYPQTKKQLFAGFEKWVMNEKNFSPENKTNGTAANRGNNEGNPGTSEARSAALKEWGK